MIKKRKNLLKRNLNIKENDNGDDHLPTTIQTKELELEEEENILFCPTKDNLLLLWLHYCRTERLALLDFLLLQNGFFSTTDTTNDEVFLFVVGVVNVIMLLLLLWNSQVLLSRLYLRLVLIIIERTAPAMTSKINKRSVFCSSYCFFLFV